MNCVQEIAAAIDAVRWWHVLLVFPAAFIWGVASRFAELVVDTVFPSSKQR